MGTALDKYADMEPQWDHPVVIESHINGVRSKEMNPNTPTSYDEIAEDAIRCWEAGAGAIHAHNTSFDLLGENAYKDYMRTWEKVLAKHPDITWYPTTCNNLRLVGDENGLEHVLYLNDNAHAQIACVDTGLTLFATGTDEDGYLQGPEFGFNYAAGGQPVADVARARHPHGLRRLRAGAPAARASTTSTRVCRPPARCGTSTSSATTG